MGIGPMALAQLSGSAVSVYGLIAFWAAATTSAPMGSRTVRTGRTTSAACDSLPAARDTFQYQVYASLEVPTEKFYGADGNVHQDTVPSQFRAMVLEAIERYYVPPVAPPVSVYLILDAFPPGAAQPFVFGEAVLTLGPTGGLTEQALVQSSLSPAIDRSLLDAIRRADSAQAFPLPLAAGKAHISRLYVSLTTRSYDSRPGVPLFTIRLPWWRGATPPAPDTTRPAKQPAYPEDLLRRGFEGTLWMAFVVDEHGDAVPSTISLLRSDITRPSDLRHEDLGHEAKLGDFVRVILPSIQTEHFIPAMIQGCPVKSYSVQPFFFRVKRS